MSSTERKKKTPKNYCSGAGAVLEQQFEENLALKAEENVGQHNSSCAASWSQQQASGL